MQWDPSPDLLEPLRRLKETACVRYQRTGATAQVPAPFCAPQSLPKWEAYDLVNLESFHPQSVILQEQRETFQGLGDTSCDSE